MTRFRVLLILAAVDLAALPGCLGHTSNARVCEQNQTRREVMPATIIVPAPAAQPRPPSLSMSDVALPPAKNDVPADPLLIRQTALARGVGPGTREEENSDPSRPLPLAPRSSSRPPSPAPCPSPEQPKATLAVPASALPLARAFMCVLDDQPDKALAHLKDFDPATQDFLIRVLPAIAKLGHKPLDAWDSEEVAVLQDQFEGVLEALRPLAPLTISRMCCCKSIKGFGQYEPLPEDHLFHAASTKDSRDGEFVTVYLELKNIRCLHRSPYHEIRLASKVEISDPRDPNKSWSYRFEDQKQAIRSRAELHDFSNHYTFSVPHLPPGLYTLKIEVADLTNPEHKRVARQSQDFRVTAMPATMP